MDDRKEQSAKEIADANRPRGPLGGERIIHSPHQSAGCIFDPDTPVRKHHETSSLAVGIGCYFSIEIGDQKEAADFAPTVGWVMLPQRYVEALHIDPATLVYDMIFKMPTKANGVKQPDTIGAPYLIPSITFIESVTGSDDKTTYENYVFHDVPAYILKEEFDEPIIGKSLVGNMQTDCGPFGCEITW